MIKEVTHIAVAVCIPVSICIHLQNAAQKSEECRVHRWAGCKFHNIFVPITASLRFSTRQLT
jgi:hypothetical protein